MAGDGTTSVTVLCGALLKKSLELLEKGVSITVRKRALRTSALMCGVERWAGRCSKKSLELLEKGVSLCNCSLAACELRPRLQKLREQQSRRAEAVPA